jgi:hypothetical protein
MAVWLMSLRFSLYESRSTKEVALCLLKEAKLLEEAKPRENQIRPHMKLHPN